MTAATLPDVFLAYQQRFMAAVYENRVVVEEKSRRTGFSWAAGAVAALFGAATQAGGGSDVFYMGYNLEMAREFIDYVAEWAKSIEPAAAAVQEYLFTDPEHPEKEIKAFRVEFASGFKVLALPSMPRALRGMQGLVIIDEAAFHDDLEELLKAAFALLIWGGRVVIISTHNGDTNPFAVLVNDIRAKRKPYYLGRTTFDEALADGLYQRICLKEGRTWSPKREAVFRAEIIANYGDMADEELHVIPSPSTGAWLSGNLIDARSMAGIPVLRWECTGEFALWAEHVRRADAEAWCEEHLAPVLRRLNRDDHHVLGEDFARRGDLSVQWPLAIGRDMVRRTPFVVELRNVPFEQQRQILFYVLDRLPRLRAVHLDAGGNGMYLAEVTAQRYGALVAQVMMTEPWYRENMPPLKAAFEDSMFELPVDRDIATDFRSIKLVRGIPRVPDAKRNSTQPGRHGDAAIAAALAYAASRAEYEEYGYDPAPKSGSTGSGGAKWREALPDHYAEDNPVPGRGGLLPALGNLRW